MGDAPHGTPFCLFKKRIGKRDEKGMSQPVGVSYSSLPNNPDDKGEDTSIEVSSVKCCCF